MVRRRSDGSLGDGNIDPDLLYCWLFRTAKPDGQVAYRRQDLATWLGVDYPTICRHLHSLVDDGRLKKSGWRLFVVDPSLARWTIKRQAIVRRRMPPRETNGGFRRIRPVWRYHHTSTK